MEENPGVVEQRRWISNERADAIGMHPPSRHLLSFTIVAAVILIAVLAGIAGYIEKWLWMRQLD